jgi:hypothetical protein
VPQKRYRTPFAKKGTKKVPDTFKKGTKKGTGHLLRANYLILWDVDFNCSMRRPLANAAAWEVVPIDMGDR